MLEHAPRACVLLEGQVCSRRRIGMGRVAGGATRTACMSHVAGSMCSVHPLTVCVAARVRHKHLGYLW